MILSYAEKITIKDLRDGYDALNSDAEDIDYVAIGCPHASLEELKEIASLLKGRKVKATTWITTARAIKEKQDPLQMR